MTVENVNLVINRGNVMNKSRNYDFDLWVTKLREDFEFNAFDKENYADRLNVIKKTKTALTQFIATPEITPAHVELAKTFLESIDNSFEEQYLNIMAPKQNKPKRRGKKGFWRVHLELVVFALESARGNKNLLADIRQVLESNDPTHASKNSLYWWIKQLTPRQQKSLPIFKSVTTRPHEQPTQWATEMKHEYLNKLVAISKRNKRPSSREEELNRLMAKLTKEFPTLEKYPEPLRDDLVPNNQTYLV